MDSEIWRRQSILHHMWHSFKYFCIQYSILLALVLFSVHWERSEMTTPWVLLFSRRTFDFSCLDKVTTIWRTWGQVWSKKRLEKTNEGFSNPGYCSRFIRPLNKITEINKIILITLSHWSSSGFITERKYWLSQENILLLKSVW